MPKAQAAVDRLIQALSGCRIPMPLFRQHLPIAERFADTPLDPLEVLIWRIEQILNQYHDSYTNHYWIALLHLNHHFF